MPATTKAKAPRRRRIYIVTRLDNNVETLVRAPLRTSAMGHVATSEYQARRATEDDLVRLLPTHQVEDAEAAT